MVCPSICHGREYCKTAEPIEMQFEMLSRVGLGPGMHALDIALMSSLVFYCCL